jgi:hypothetical protein
MSTLTAGTTIDGHEVLHDGNHNHLKSPHPQYSSMTPEFYTEGVGVGYYVKLIEICSIPRAFALVIMYLISCFGIYGVKTLFTTS